MDRPTQYRGILIVCVIALCGYFALRSRLPEHQEMSPYRKPNEYRLPANDIPAEVRERLHPWIAGFIGLTPEQANRRVAERWSSIERPSLRALRETLTQFSVEAIVDFGEGGLIRTFRETKGEIGCGDFWYLAGPLGNEEITKRLAPSGLQANEALREFLSYFSGLAEDTTVAGHFVYSPAPWELFTDSWDGTIDGFDAWKNSLMVYNARNGCHVLVRKDGKVAWWIMQEHRVELIAENFDEFILQFNEHRKMSRPFDPYARHR